jgi:hypothetical protein
LTAVDADVHVDPLDSQVVDHPGHRLDDELQHPVRLVRAAPSHDSSSPPMPTNPIDALR